MAHVEHAKRTEKIDAKRLLRRTARTLWLAPQMIAHAILHPLSPTYVQGWFVTNWGYTGRDAEGNDAHAADDPTA